jgi:L-2-hydroxyglutarate oxidase LhgO
LAQRSKHLWEQLAAGQQPHTSTALQAALEWQANGSLLLATTDTEVQQLQQRAQMLQGQGIEGVVLLSPREMQMLEPALQLPPGSRGLLVKSDAQIVSMPLWPLDQAAAGDTRCCQRCK